MRLAHEMDSLEPDQPRPLNERSPAEPWWESSAAQLPSVLARLQDDSHDEVDLCQANCRFDPLGELKN